jgi:molecular chaperone GrpE
MNGTEEEFVPEDEAEEGAGALKKLREKLKKAIEEKQEYLEGWQRARADLVNFKKETETGHGESRERLKAELIEELIPALDVLELSLRHEKNQTLSMLEKQFLMGLQKLGIERFGAVGEDFDPQKHEAIAMKGDEHKIQSVERSGYKAGERIIRPAQVII